MSAPAHFSPYRASASDMHAKVTKCFSMLHYVAGKFLRSFLDTRLYETLSHLRHAY